MSPTLRKTMVAALTAAAVVAALAAPAHAAYQTAQCVPTAGRPAVSTGDITTEATSIGVKINVRHAGSTTLSGDSRMPSTMTNAVPVAVTVHVTVDYGDGNPYDTTVVVPASSPQSVGGSSTERRTTAQLSVPRSSHHQGIAVTVNDHSSYKVCRRHALKTFTGVNQRVPPPPTTTLPEQEPVVEPERYPRPEPAENPTNPDGTTNLYGPGGLLTDERRLQWQCWAAFGNTQALREHGLINETQSC